MQKIPYDATLDAVWLPLSANEGIFQNFWELTSIFHRRDNSDNVTITYPNFFSSMIHVWYLMNEMGFK